MFAVRWSRDFGKILLTTVSGWEAAWGCIPMTGDLAAATIGDRAGTLGMRSFDAPADLDPNIGRAASSLTSWPVLGR